MQLFDRKSPWNIAAAVAIFLFSGLLRAQGGVTVYNTTNSGLPVNSVWAVATGPDGKVWFGTDWGLASLDGNAWQVYQTTNSGLPNDAIKSVMVDANNHVWVGTSVGGLAHFDGANWEVYNTANSALPSDQVRCLDRDASGAIYMGTDNGVAKFDGVNWVVWDLPSLGVGSNNVPAIEVHGVDSFWVGTINGGLVHIQDTAVQIYTHANSGLLDNTQVGLVQDSGDDLWIATPSDGLIYFQNLVFLTYNSTNSGNPTQSHSSVVLDAVEGKWAGSLDHGVVYYDSPIWRYWDPTNSAVPQAYVRCLAVAGSDGRIWGGTASGGAFVLEPSILLGAEGDGLAHRVSVGPNPAAAWVRCAGEWDALTLRDLHGRAVLRAQASAGGCDVSSLPNGSYVMEIAVGAAVTRLRLLVAH